MKVLVVSQYYYPENVIVSKIAEQFVKDGHDVRVLTAKPNYGYGRIVPGYENIDEEVINGVRVHRVNVYPRKKSRLSIIKNYLSFWINSKKWVRKTKEEFDVVYSVNLSPITECSAANIYAKKHHVKHILHCLDLWPESVVVTKAVRKNTLMYRLLYIWSKKIYSKADTILVSSPSFADYFRDVLHLPTKNIKYVPQTSLIEDVDISPYEYGEGTHILYCGNLGLIQLIPYITLVMDRLRDKNIYFHIIGMGPMTDYLVNDIKEKRLEDKVIYHGPIIAKLAASYFKNADALYISLKGEGAVGKTIPSKLLMSMAFKRPIIGVLRGDGRKVLNDSEGGFVAEEDVESIKNAILAVANLSKKEKDHLGDLNYRYYLENFSVDKITSLIEKEFIK